VTSWEVWYGEPKADSIVSLRVGRYIVYAGATGNSSSAFCDPGSLKDIDVEGKVVLTHHIFGKPKLIGKMINLII